MLRAGAAERDGGQGEAWCTVVKHCSGAHLRVLRVKCLGIACFLVLHGKAGNRAPRAGRTGGLALYKGVCRCTGTVGTMFAWGAR